MFKIFLLSLTLASVSYTISFTSIVKFLRNLFNGIHPKLGELIHCPWCLSHWIVIVISLFIYDNYQIDIFIFDLKLFNYITEMFAIICLSGVLHYVLLRAYEPVAKSMFYTKKR